MVEQGCPHAGGCGGLGRDCATMTFLVHLVPALRPCLFRPGFSSSAVLLFPAQLLSILHAFLAPLSLLPALLFFLLLLRHVHMHWSLLAVGPWPFSVCRLFFAFLSCVSAHHNWTLCAAQAAVCRFRLSDSQLKTL